MNAARDRMPSRAPLSDAFAHVEPWVFALDNTLYPPHVRLFDQIEERMTEYVMNTLDVTREHADTLRRDYWHRHGTTLAGLMQEHDLDPAPYLTAVHDISFEALEPDLLLAERLAALPGRRIVYTNGSAPYARRVIEARGLDGLFDAVYGVEDAGFEPKPRRAAFERVFSSAAVEPTRAAMFEDEPRNLAEPHAMGMRTVLVAPDRVTEDHIHHHTDDLTAFLRHLS